MNILPALILMGRGMVFVPMQNLALFGVAKDDSGIAIALLLIRIDRKTFSGADTEGRPRPFGPEAFPLRQR
ncbi:hypothetical protein ACFVWT_11925 [Arthrobacter sp. NPDC058288]|uniref:hypothetical protein n=1 Tax=Arthrobacter sp. NPDC058288 TaxID=3346424 RepID=UPI0036E58D6D